MNKLIIIGASGHGKVVADIASLNGYNDIVFLDDDENVKFCGEYPVIGKSSDLPDEPYEIAVAVGNASVRKMIMERLHGRKFPVLIHPASVVAKDVVIDAGSVIMAGAIINPGTRVGRGCIVNTSSSVDHDCILMDYVHVSVGAHLAGTVTVGAESWIGAGAIVSNNISICSNCMIGAGAVVVRNIDFPGTYTGVPAKKRK